MESSWITRLADDPDDEDAWSVFIDQLLEQGDPRGRLAAADDPEAVLRELAPVWFGPDARVDGTRVVFGGDPDERLPQHSWVALDFERGHVHALRLGLVVDAIETDEEGLPTWGQDWIPKRVADLVVRDVGRLIDRFDIHQGPDWTGETQCDALLESVLRGGELAARSLRWGSDHDWEFVELPERLADLLMAAPHLKRAVLQGTSGILDTVRHDRLEVLELGAMYDRTLEAFSRARLPALRDLRLWLEFHDIGEVFSEVESLGPLLATPLPSLRRLSLPGYRHVEALLEELPGAVWFAQLEELELDGLTDEGRRVTEEERFAHLRVVVAGRGV